MPTSPARGGTRSPRRYLHSLWLLSERDLRVRYATSAIGYLWTLLDPLAMSLIYWFVFTQVFHRAEVGETPYIVFLLTALLPWVWFNAAVTDFTWAFNKDAKLVRSLAIPRSIWVNRIILSKGVEFALALPVLALFAIFSGAQVGWQLVLFPVAIVWQIVLLAGIGLLVAPLCVLWVDLERTTKLVLRVLFYASPVIYGVADLPAGFAQFAGLNPLAGIFVLYRVGFFPGQWDSATVLTGLAVTAGILLLGGLTFRRLERAMAKEL